MIIHDSKDRYLHRNFQQVLHPFDLGPVLAPQQSTAQGNKLLSLIAHGRQAIMAGCHALRFTFVKGTCKHVILCSIPSPQCLGWLFTFSEQKWLSLVIALFRLRQHVAATDTYTVCSMAFWVQALDLLMCKDESDRALLSFHGDPRASRELEALACAPRTSFYATAL